jgi:hypothetical protein
MSMNWEAFFTVLIGTLALMAVAGTIGWVASKLEGLVGALWTAMIVSGTLLLVISAMVGLVAK